MSTNAYGWGFLQNMVGQTVGAAGSVQVRVDNTTLNGDSGFTYDTSTGIVTITGGLVVAGTPIGVGNMRKVPASATQEYIANSMNVIYTEDDDIVTIEADAKMIVGEGAIVKFKRYSEE